MLGIQIALIQPDPAILLSQGLAQEVDKACDIHYKSMTKSSGPAIIDSGKYRKHRFSWLGLRYREGIARVC